jgi:predicted neutral ceramidase superfamily lipid hydrolase
LHISFDEILELHKKITEMRIEYWLNHVLFTFQWWLLLLSLIVPWIIWWRIVDRKRIKDILLFGLLIMIVVTILDETGRQLQLWSYPYQIVPFLPHLITVNYGIIAFFHMLVFQRYSNWPSFIIANVIMALIFSFLLEPLTEWLGIYRLDNWKHFYSLPIYVSKAILIKAVVEKINNKGASS